MSSYQTHQYTCLDPACNRPFQCPNHLQRHWKQVHDSGKGGIFKCKECPKTIGFKTQRYLTMHTAKKHAETEFEKQLILCPEDLCNEMFLKRLDLQRHVEKLHNKKLRMLLRLCKACFTNGDRLIFKTEMDMLAHLEQCDSHESATENNSNGSHPSTSTLPRENCPSIDAPVQEYGLIPAGCPMSNGNNIPYWIPHAVPFADHLALMEPYAIGPPSSQSLNNGLTASTVSNIYSIAQPSTDPVSSDWNPSAPQHFFSVQQNNMKGEHDLTGPHISTKMIFQSYHNLNEPQAPPVSNINTSIWPGMGEYSSFAPQYLPQSHTEFVTWKETTVED